MSPSELFYPDRGILPVKKGIGYKQHSAIIRELSKNPASYDKDTGWTDTARELYESLYAAGFGI
jgi:hypothetical protein